MEGGGSRQNVYPLLGGYYIGKKSYIQPKLFSVDPQMLLSNNM